MEKETRGQDIDSTGESQLQKGVKPEVYQTKKPGE